MTRSKPMTRSNHRAWARRTVAAGLLAALAGGCATTDKEPDVHYLGKASLKYYEDHATEVDYPAGVEGDIVPLANSDAPRAVTDRRHDDVWDLSLTEALHCTLSNNKVIRSRISRGNPAQKGLGTSTLTGPDTIVSIYDPAIQESGVLFGGRGVEAALADFDATYSATALWGRNEQFQNNGLLNPGVTGLFEQVSETATVNNQIGKTFATGGSATVFHNWNYLGTNSPATAFPSSYSNATGVTFRQPLLAGAGVEYTRVAGPRNPNFGAITGVNQGVLIARINNDITLANFEISTRNLLKDVEDAYWNLYFAYRQYDTALTARNSALRGWREAQAKLLIGGAPNFKPADEAQARDRYFETRAQVETALNQIYTSEAEIRRLMGLPPNDGRVIRPLEEPATAKFVPDWHASLCEALVQRAELRRQKWNIKSLELQLTAAENLTMPALDFVSGYQVNGFGDDLLGTQANSTNQNLGSAYGNLLGGNQTGWNLGVNLTVPIGFRQARTQVRNIELRLAKAREVLSTQELDVAHEVADAIQAIEYNYQNAETNFNRRNAAARRVALFEAELEAGTVTLDEVLRAQASLATAEVAYFQSLVQYNQAISYLHFVKGTLLERDNVQLEEGKWNPQAYQQALRRAWERSNAFRDPFKQDDRPPFGIPDDSRSLTLPGGETIHSKQMSDGTAPPAAPQGGTVPPAPATEPPANPFPGLEPQPVPETPTPADITPTAGLFPGAGKVHPLLPSGYQLPNPAQPGPTQPGPAQPGPANQAAKPVVRTLPGVSAIGPRQPASVAAAYPASSLFPAEPEDRLPVRVAASAAVPGRASVDAGEVPMTTMTTLGSPRGPATRGVTTVGDDEPYPVRAIQQTSFSGGFPSP